MKNGIWFFRAMFEGENSIVMDCHGLLWTVVDCHDILLAKHSSSLDHDGCAIRMEGWGISNREVAKSYNNFRCILFYNFEQLTTTTTKT